MFQAVQAEEIAFAMTLFVSAASGQAPRGPVPVREEAQSRQEFEQFFLDLSLGQQELQDPARRRAALNSSLCLALKRVWNQYDGDRLQRGICARVLSFCYLMEDTHGDVVAGLASVQADAQEHVVLHPAVIEAVASAPLSERGLLSRHAFTRQLQQILEERDDAPARPGGTAPEDGEADRAEAAAAWPHGDGEMAERIRNFPWSSHPLGDSAAWPQSLRTAVDLMLACRFPMIVLWGENLLQLYNDGYRDVMGRKHPAGLGQATATCWAEVWTFNKPVYARVLAGESVTFENQLFPIDRYGYLENAYFTLCYSPLRDEQGRVAGALVTVFETTSKARLFAERGRPDAQEPGGGVSMRAVIPVTTAEEQFS